ncbi:MAG: inorganic phosphate transporter [Solirubrobacteraceae bacterium]
MDTGLILLVVVVALALVFDFTNGFHDAANAIATSVSTRALRPRPAVAMAGVLNFAGAFVSLEVAASVATGIVESVDVTLTILASGLIGSIAWNITTWWLGLPTSSSHALIGGMVGAVAAATAFGGIKWNGLVEKVLVPSAAAPLIGFLVAGTIGIGLAWIIRSFSQYRVNRVFRMLQVGSAGFMAFTHGTNDAQKTMGLIALALIAHGTIDPDEFEVPLWVVISAATAMALGTYVGGWRIIRTLGTRVVKLEPPQGFAAETAAGSVLLFTGNVGFPVSTTHTISGAIMGAGASRRVSAVRWGIAGRILVAWVITIPAASSVGALCYGITRLPAGGLLLTVLTAAVALLAARRWQRSREAPVTASPYAPPA